MAPHRRLGRSTLEITPIGLGCWQFSGGHGAAGTFWDAVPPETMDAIVLASLRGGVNWFDTAEVYGRGRSEQALAHALKAANAPREQIVVATKWWPLLRTAASIRETIEDRLHHLGGLGVDLHQVHHPYSLASVTSQMNAMADLARAGLIRAVGVSNFSARRMRAAHAALAARGQPLVSNQVQYSLLDRDIEHNGVIAAARELGMTIIAYSPLAQGVLSGRFHDQPERLRDLAVGRRHMGHCRAGRLARSRPVIEELRAIAAAHGATLSQVALAWLVQFHGDLVVAIPGASRAVQAEENARVMDLTLNADELSRLDAVSRDYHR